MKRLIFIFYILYSFVVKSQDVVNTQTFGSPMYLNPAFAGNLAKTSFYLNARQQWFKVDGGYTSSSFSANHRLDNINSGVGLMIKQDEEGSAKYSKTNVSGIYTYILHLNNDWTISPGIQLTYVNSKLDPSTFTFGDQINDDFSVNSSTTDPMRLSSSSNIDVSSGAVLYNNNFWFGFSTHHLMEPSNFITSTSLKRKFSTHTGYQYEYKSPVLPESIFFSPSLILNFQGDFIRTGVNFVTTYHFISVGTGVSNITSSFSIQNILNSYFLIGYSDDHFKVGYSYDFTIKGAVGFGGAHEISIGILLNYDNNSNPNPLKHKKIRKVSCPKF